MQLKELIVTKAGGQQDLFSIEKLRSSMKNAGAEEHIIEKIIEEITPRLYQGISTKKIYKWAFSLLKQRSKHIAAKYQLKKAIMELGPDGFIFERFISELFKRKGFKTKVGQILQGKCIPHEVDVLATNNEELLMIECKYHSQPGKVSDVKVSLYIHSRFRDLESTWKKQREYSEKKMSAWVVTNTRFSPDAVQYAICSDMKLLGWDYPVRNGIKDLIDEFRLYPITCLTNLTKAEKEEMLAQGILFCSSLIGNRASLETIGMKETRIKNIMDEVDKLTCVS
jgi:hypothetical protein